MHTELRIDASRRRSPRITSVGGLAGRQTGPDTVHLIGTAATPLGGDTISVRISVAAGARLDVRSVAASLAMPGAAQRHSSAHWHVELGAGRHSFSTPSRWSSSPMPLIRCSMSSNWNKTRICGCVSAYRSAGSTRWRDSGRVRCTAMWEAGRCCATGWNWGGDGGARRVVGTDVDVQHASLSGQSGFRGRSGGRHRALGLGRGGSLSTSVGHRLQPTR